MEPHMASNDHNKAAELHGNAAKSPGAARRATRQGRSREGYGAFQGVLSNTPRAQTSKVIRPTLRANNKSN